MQSNQLRQTTEVFTLVKVEGTIDELKLLFIDPASGKFEPSKGKKATKKATKKAKPVVKRAPSAYNKYMKKELAKLKKAHPRMTHQARFKKAAKGWKRSKKGAKK